MQEIDERLRNRSTSGEGGHFDCAIVPGGGAAKAGVREVT